MERTAFLRLSGEGWEDLYLCFCGYEECKPFYGYGPSVRSHYVLHYILRGRGTYQVGSQTWELKRGDAFLIEPQVQTYYQADGEDPWTYIWVGFDGKKAKQVLWDLGLGGERLSLHCKKESQLKQVVLNMLRNNVHISSDRYLLMSQLYLFFGILMSDSLPQGKGIAEGEREEGNPYVQVAKNFIRNNFSDPKMKVGDIAAFVNLDRSYLYSLFRREMGLSPQEYLTRYRIDRAVELLENTQVPVEGVALSCGYSDPVAFSKAFKRLMGVTPLRRRQMNLAKESGEMKKNQGTVGELEEEEEEERAGKKDKPEE